MLIAAVCREGDVDGMEGEGLCRRFEVGAGNVGDSDLEDVSDSVRPGCARNGNVFRGESGLVSLLRGPGVYECRCKLGVDGVERVL